MTFPVRKTPDYGLRKISIINIICQILGELMSRVDYRGLAALDAVIDYGSFDKAAAALAITQSAVSQRIRMLENSAGELLIVRSQPPSPTEAGQRLIAHYRQVRLLESALAKRPGDAESRPEIAIAVNADSAATWLQEAVTPLMANGDCMLQIRLDDQDHTLTMLREGRVFGCVTSETAQVAGTTVTAAGRDALFLRRQPGICRPLVPGRHDGASGPACAGMNFDRKDMLQTRFMPSAPATPAAIRTIPCPVQTALCALSRQDSATACCRSSNAAAAARSTLIDLAPGDWLDVPLVWHMWDIQTPFTRALSDNLIATARKWLIQA
jgi:LysR family transcriptional regulator (chromosome initiation inhibitor)